MPSKRKARQRDLQARQYVEQHGPDQIKAQLTRMGFADFAGLFTPDGKLKKNPHDIPVELRAAIRGLKIRDYYDQAGETVSTHFDSKLEPKRESLHDLAQMAGLLQEAPLMQMGLRININMTPPAAGYAPGPAHATPRPGFEPITDAPVVEVPFEPVPAAEPMPETHSGTAPGGRAEEQRDEARRQRDAAAHAVSVQRALHLLSRRPRGPGQGITD
jgi:hypothetical protein